MAQNKEKQKIDHLVELYNSLDGNSISQEYRDYINNISKALKEVDKPKFLTLYGNFLWNKKGIKDLIKTKNINDINSQDMDGETPIFFAAHNEMENEFEWLLKNGADVNIKNKNGLDLLTSAISENNLFVVDHLLNHPDTDYYATIDQTLNTSALYEAALENQDLIPDLIKKGMPITRNDVKWNTKDSRNNLPLFYHKRH